jgi:heat shock protein HslJ
VLSDEAGGTQALLERPGAAPASETTAPSGPDGRWQWVRSEYGDDTVVDVLDPSRYTIEFRPDGTVSIRADCNRVGGTYSLDGPAMAFALGPSTLIGCPADSQANVFMKDLNAVVTYVFDGENLVLNMRFDTGNLILQPS